MRAPIPPASKQDVEELPGYEQAARVPGLPSSELWKSPPFRGSSEDHLKGQGKDKFARGEVNEAITCRGL